jgi:hypothetical protein
MKKPVSYGLGLDVVVVVVVEVDEFGGVVAVVVVLVVVVSLFLSVEAGGFTIVVLFSVFFSAGDEAGAATSVFCSHAPRSAAPARMQSNFFIVWIGLPNLGPSLNRSVERLRPCRRSSFAAARLVPRTAART